MAAASPVPSTGLGGRLMKLKDGLKEKITSGKVTSTENGTANVFELHVLDIKGVVVPLEVDLAQRATCLGDSEPLVKVCVSQCMSSLVP